MVNSLLLQAAAAPAPSGFGMLMPLVLIVGIMYLFMIRPQQKKQKDDNTKIEFNRTAIATVIADKVAEEPKAEKKSLFGKKAKKTEETAPAATSEAEEK